MRPRERIFGLIGFDGGLQDIFDLQDRVTAKVVGEIAPRLEQVEIERGGRKQTENLDAYDYYLRALASLPNGPGNPTMKHCGYFIAPSSSILASHPRMAWRRCAFSGAR